MCTRRGARLRKKLRPNRNPGASPFVDGGFANDYRPDYRPTTTGRERDTSHAFATGDDLVRELGANLWAAQANRPAAPLWSQFVGEIGAFFDRFLETAFRFVRPVETVSRASSRSAAGLSAAVAQSSERATDQGRRPRQDRSAESNCCTAVPSELSYFPMRIRTS